MKKITKLLVAATCAGSMAASAAIITQVENNGSAGTSDWNVPSTWSDGNAPSTGNTYSMTNRVNTPDTPTTPQTFGGDSLQLEGGSANFQVRARDGANDAVTVNLIMNGGRMQLNKASTSWGQVEGTISVIGTTTIQTYQNATSQRQFRINSLISGTTSLLLRGTSGYVSAGDQYIQIGNDGNTFAGNWDVLNTRAIFTSAGATGSGDFTVGNGGYLRINDSWTGAMSVVDGAAVDVGANTFVLDLSANGSAVADGTYSVADLNTEIGSTIFSGTGTIQVIPEPATLGLVAAFGGALLFTRRRFMS